MARDGVVYTPPATEGALESITLDFVEKLAKSLNIPFVRRPIDRTEILIANELAICGTLAELVSIKNIDGQDIDPNGSVLKKIRDKFFRIVRGLEENPDFEATYIPESKIKKL